MPILAQADLTNVPADTLKWVLIILVALLGVGATILGIIYMVRKPEPQKLADEPPINVQKAPRRFNHELAEQRYGDHERRLAALETWRETLISKLDADKEEILKAGEERKDELQKQINELPSKIVADILNTKKIFS